MHSPQLTTYTCITYSKQKLSTLRKLQYHWYGECKFRLFFINFMAHVCHKYDELSIVHFLIQVLSGKRTYVDVYWYKYFNNLRLIWKRWRIKRIAVSNFPFFRLNSSIGIFVFTKIICFLGILPYYNKLSRTIVHKVLASIVLFKSRLKLLFTKML